ncbi:hypothetical protein HZC00_03795 [Candidatus Kaiserbacteria bacterium]|nr:hypothetical protein [Candidatus Kaiserbacteria bacterium]
MQTEIQDFIDEEEYVEGLNEDVEYASASERESRETAEYEKSEDSEEAERQEPAEPGEQAVLEQKGGEEDDWEHAYSGDSGYWFDGQNIRDPEGNVWMNEDTTLHQEMLAQWREGGDRVFFLPDYREQTADGEILYVTQLILGENGLVTYEIHKHEIMRAEDERMVQEETGVAETSAIVRTEQPEDTIPSEAQETINEVLAFEAIAHEAVTENEKQEGEKNSEQEPVAQAESILHAIGVPMTRLARSPELPARYSLPNTQRSVAAPPQNDNTEIIRPRSPLRSRVSKDGIILEMAA